MVKAVDYVNNIKNNAVFVLIGTILGILIVFLVGLLMLPILLNDTTNPNSIFSYVLIGAFPYGLIISFYILRNEWKSIPLLIILGVVISSTIFHIFFMLFIVIITDSIFTLVATFLSTIITAVVSSIIGLLWVMLMRKIVLRFLIITIPEPKISVTQLCVIEIEDFLYDSKIQSSFFKNDLSLIAKRLLDLEKRFHKICSIAEERFGIGPTFQILFSHIEKLNQHMISLANDYLERSKWFTQMGYDKIINVPLDLMSNPNIGDDNECIIEEQKKFANETVKVFDNAIPTLDRLAHKIIKLNETKPDNVSDVVKELEKLIEDLENDKPKTSFIMNLHNF